MKRYAILCVLAAAALAGAPAAQAVTITADATAYVAGANPEWDTMTQTALDVAWAYAETWKGTPWWECGDQYPCDNYEASWAWARGTAEGDIRVGAVHELGQGYGGEFVGPADGSAFASVTWEETYTVTQGQTFDFTVNDGGLSVRGDDPGSGTLEAWYLIQILVGGSEAWRSEGTLTATYDDTNGWSLTYADDSGDLEESSIYRYADSDYVEAFVYFSEQSFSIDLSQWAGQIVPITYYMAVSASDPTVVEVPGGFNWAEARFGDPFPPPQPVPEPGTVILVGSGLAGLGALRRRRRRAEG